MTTKENENDSGADAAAVVLAGSSASDQLSHAAPGNTDGAKADVVLAAIAYCASKWEWGARLLGNIQSIDIQIAAEKAGNALRENEFMKSCGIVELAIRNPNVAAYIDHWEFRAERAERAEKALREMLERLSSHPHCSYTHPANGTGSYSTGVADGHRCVASEIRTFFESFPVGSGNQPAQEQAPSTRRSEAP